MKSGPIRPQLFPPTGSGEMSTLIRQFDWSATAVGHPDQWPQSLRMILNVILSAKFPMFLWWGPEQIQFYNDAYRPSLGATGKHPAALGQPGEACWPEIWSGIKPMIDQVMAGGEAIGNEDQLIPIYRNGRIETVYWTYSYSPVCDEAGGVAGVLVICQETTRQVLVARQERLQTEGSEAYLHRIFAHAAVGIAIFRGADFIIEVANPAVCVIWGRTETEVLGKPLFEALPEAAGQGFEGLLTEVMRTNQPFTGKELPAIINRSGQLTTVYFDFVYEPLPDADGLVNSILVTATDATERRHTRRLLERSEANLRMLFEQAPVAVAILRGPELTYELANNQYLALVDRVTPGDLIGRPMLEVLPELREQGLDALLHEVMRTGKAFTASRHSVDLFRHGRLETGYFDFVYEPMPGVAGPHRAGVFVLAIEVTGQVVAQQLADQLLVRERALNDLKSNFVTLASHEFRTPMGTILSSAALIGRYTGADEADKRDRHVQRIKSAVHSLTGLLNDFLSLSQMEQTTMHGHPQPLDLGRFCDEVIEDMQGVIKPGQQVVYRHVTGPSTVSIDGQMLKNILINLLVNASKYSADEKEIELTTTVLDSQLVITVKDSGIGIPDADKDKLFINFFRARNAVHIAGTGLGLYVVKRYVDLLGGTITFTSELDSGTIFTVQLPLSPLPA